MKNAIVMAWAIYTFNFIIGYAAMHMVGKEKAGPACVKLMEYTVEHTTSMLIVMPGEDNGCLDFGYYPIKTGSEPESK